jgi:SH3-like domain-containing protein
LITDLARMNTHLAGILLLALSVCVTARAEPVDAQVLGMLRVVEDKDGFVNVRTAPSLNSAIRGKVTAGAAVSVTGKAGDFTMISLESGQEGYIHTSRLKALTGWKQAAARVAGKTATARLGEAVATVTAAPFVAKEHKITKDRQGVELVDGRTVWGKDGGIPDTQFRLAMTLDGEPLRVPIEATHDLFQPNLETLAILSPGKPATQTLVFMANSDGAGAYCVVWAFAGGKYAGRTVFVPY